MYLDGLYLTRHPIITEHPIIVLVLFQYIIWVTDYTCTKRSKVSGQSACLSLPTDNRPTGQICYIIISDKAPPGQRVEPTWGQILL